MGEGGGGGAVMGLVGGPCVWLACPAPFLLALTTYAHLAEEVEREAGHV